MAAWSRSRVVWIYWCRSSVSTSAKMSTISSLVTPRARKKVVTETRRLRSTLTDNTSLLLVSNSSQAPREGIICATQRFRSVAAFFSYLKYTPGERTNWLTTTRSAPLMMKVPCSVINGNSPMNMSCSSRSPVSSLMSRAFSVSGWE